jgi:hypothetical protein
MVKSQKFIDQIGLVFSFFNFISKKLELQIPYIVFRSNLQNFQGKVFGCNFRLQNA